MPTVRSQMLKRNSSRCVYKWLCASSIKRGPSGDRLRAPLDPPIRWLVRSLSPGIKRYPHRVEVKNARNFTALSAIHLHGVVLRHSENFAFYPK
jgi:hypothetical protein